MIVIERKPGQAVMVGPYTLQVLAVQFGRVVVALLDADRECVFCGQGPVRRRQCFICQAETVVCSGCLPSQACPRCGSAWEKE